MYNIVINGLMGQKENEMNKRLVLLSAALLISAGCVGGGEANKPEPAPKGKSV